MKKILSILLALAFILCAFAGCGKEEEDKPLMSLATVLDCEYTELGALITAECDARAQGTFARFVTE